MSDKKDTDKSWLALIKEIFVFELIFSLIDWIFGILRSRLTILRINSADNGNFGSIDNIFANLKLK